MGVVLVLGEVLMRLTPPSNLKLGQTTSLSVCFGGAEANVAVGLSNLGVRSRILTSLPSNEIGDAAKSFLKSNDVDCNCIVSKGERLGLYYYEEGASARKAKVVYDRKYSSITELNYEDIDLNKALDNVDLLHVSGITFALGERVSFIAKNIINEAKKRGIKISVDLNYRAKLWSSYEEFTNTMTSIVTDSYLCFGWINKDKKNYKVLDASTDNINDDMFIENFNYMTKELRVKNVATTLRSGTTYNYHTLVGIIYNGDRLYKSSKYDFSMISRIGGGDAFAAGIIKCLLNIEELNYAIEFGTACAVLKQTQIGDVSLSKESDVVELMNNKNLGSVAR